MNNSISMTAIKQEMVTIDKQQVSNWLFMEALKDPNPIAKVQTLAKQDPTAFKLVYSDV